MFSLFSKETVLYAPVNGKIIRIEDVPDQVFASKMMGEGVGFVNDGNEIYAPCDAKVIMVPSSKHAIGLKTKKGIELLIHMNCLMRLNCHKLKGLIIMWINTFLMLWLIFLMI